MSKINEISLQPARFLVENIEVLPKGRVLDVAMGHGRNAIHLAKQGFEVEGIDSSSEAVGNALEAARTCGVKLSAYVADLEDNFQIDKGAYDVIICFNYLHRPLIPQIKKGLRTGGMVVYETFIVEQAKFGKPKNPDISSSTMSFLICSAISGVFAIAKESCKLEWRLPPLWVKKYELRKPLDITKGNELYWRVRK